MHRANRPHALLWGRGNQLKPYAGARVGLRAWLSEFFSYQSESPVLKSVSKVHLHSGKKKLEPMTSLYMIRTYIILQVNESLVFSWPLIKPKFEKVILSTQNIPPSWDASSNVLFGEKKNLTDYTHTFFLVILKAIQYTNYLHSIIIVL